MNDTIARDPFGAFVPGTDIRVEGARSGPLRGLTFAAKDLYDLAGHRTGGGNPDWLASHPPAAKHARAVQALLDAGADLIGRAITVELAFGMSGDNIHYGMPINPAARDRVPGGSSCGSAAAVAGRLCDTALGSDTGGSVRIPGSYCGLYGLRPTHGRIPLDGVLPLSGSFDTVGHFARDAATFERVGRVLLRETGEPPRSRRLLWATDMAGHADAAVIAAITPLRDKLARHFGRLEDVTVCPGSLDDWGADFRTLMAREAWQAHGDWIKTRNPKFGADVAERFRIASEVTDAAVAAAKPRREAVTRHMAALLADGAVLCFPTAPGPAPLRNDPASHERMRFRAHALCCVSGLARLPQITIPAGVVDGGPVGLSLMGAQGTDAQLMRLATESAD
jgi:amidase